MPRGGAALPSQTAPLIYEYLEYLPPSDAAIRMWFMNLPLWVDVVEKVGHERVEALYWAFADQF